MSVSRLPDPMAEEMNRKADEEERALRAMMSPKGKLGLSKHLDERRLEFLIPDIVFQRSVDFDNVMMWPLGALEGMKQTPGGLWIPPVASERDKYETPRGVIIGAGQTAMDVLWGHGYELGDIVHWARLVPWVITLGKVIGRQVQVQLVDVSDLRCNEDKHERIASGQIAVERVNGKHYVCDIKGKKSAPRERWDLGDTLER